MNLQVQFHNEMVGIYHAANEIGYRPAYFIRMVSDLGGLEAAKRLLRSSVPSEGFFRLVEEERLDLTVEALVLKEPWASLFTEDELMIAKTRLEDLGYHSESPTDR